MAARRERAATVLQAVQRGRVQRRRNAAAAKAAVEAERDEEVLRASAMLRESVVPAVVAELDGLRVLPLDSESLTTFMHGRGLNMRLLGLMSEHTGMPHVHDMLVNEVCLCLCLLRHQMLTWFLCACRILFLPRSIALLLANLKLWVAMCSTDGCPSVSQGTVPSRGRGACAQVCIGTTH